MVLSHERQRSAAQRCPLCLEKRTIRSIRFSSVSGPPGQEHHTLEIQRASVKRAAPNGAYELVDVLRDEDQSGGSRIRPQLGSALARILAGAADAIILWRASRCSRHWRAAVEGEADWELPHDGPRAHARAPRCHARAHQAPAPESSPCENPVQQQPSHPSRQRGPLPPPPRQEPGSTTKTAAAIPPSNPRETKTRLDAPTRSHAIAIVGRRAGGITSGPLEGRRRARPTRASRRDSFRGRALVPAPRCLTTAVSPTQSCDGRPCEDKSGCADIGCGALEIGRNQENSLPTAFPKARRPPFTYGSGARAHVVAEEVQHLVGHARVECRKRCRQPVVQRPFVHRTAC